MNVEIGNPTYKMYEGEPEDDVGELLDADFTLDPDKVRVGVGAGPTGTLQEGCQWPEPAGAAEGEALNSGVGKGDGAGTAEEMGWTVEGSPPWGPSVPPLLTFPHPSLSPPAHQLYQPRLRHPLHGSPQQPELAGQHGREAGAAVAGRGRRPG